MPIEIAIPEIVTSWQFWAVAIACYIVCEVVKRVPYIKDRAWIVNVLNLALGIVLMCLILGFDWINVIYGILASAVADIAYQLWKNIVGQIVKVGNGDVDGGGAA